MSYNTFQWSFIGVAALAIILIIPAALGIISGWGYSYRHLRRLWW